MAEAGKPGELNFDGEFDVPAFRRYLGEQNIEPRVKEGRQDLATLDAAMGALKRDMKKDLQVLVKYLMSCSSLVKMSSFCYPFLSMMILYDLSFSCFLENGSFSFFAKISSPSSPRCCSALQGKR